MQSGSFGLRSEFPKSVQYAPNLPFSDVDEKCTLTIIMAVEFKDEHECGQG
jgi:hypothetical protein